MRRAESEPAISVNSGKPPLHCCPYRSIGTAASKRQHQRRQNGMSLSESDSDDNSVLSQARSSTAGSPPAHPTVRRKLNRKTLVSELSEHSWICLGFSAPLCGALDCVDLCVYLCSYHLSLSSCFLLPGMDVNVARSCKHLAAKHLILQFSVHIECRRPKNCRVPKKRCAVITRQHSTNLQTESIFECESLRLIHPSTGKQCAVAARILVARANETQVLHGAGRPCLIYMSRPSYIRSIIKVQERIARWLGGTNICFVDRAVT